MAFCRVNEEVKGWTYNWCSALAKRKYGVACSLAGESHLQWDCDEFETRGLHFKIT